MTDLLLHSMSEFSDIILKCLQAANAHDIVEIGSEYGGMSEVLAAFTEQQGGTLTTIDPAAKEEFTTWLKTHTNVTHLPDLSLNVLADLQAPDAWLIDGDHNWYTVFNELVKADDVSRRSGKPFLAFLHDVAWPCARRDQYYAPETIPQDFRHPYDYHGGVTLDSSTLATNRGFRGAGFFAFAKHQGGPRNGVLTAIEDFIAQTTSQDRTINLATVPAIFGLGVLYDKSALWSDDITEILAPLHNNKLIAKLEENRLRNYLAVIEWQDRYAHKGN